MEVALSVRRGGRFIPPREQLVPRFLGCEAGGGGGVSMQPPLLHRRPLHVPLLPSPHGGPGLACGLDSVTVPSREWPPRLLMVPHVAGGEVAGVWACSALGHARTVLLASRGRLDPEPLSPRHISPMTYAVWPHFRGRSRILCLFLRQDLWL